MIEKYRLYKMPSPDTIDPYLIIARSAREAVMYAKSYGGFRNPFTTKADISLLDKMPKKDADVAKQMLGSNRDKSWLETFFFVGRLPRAA